MEDDGPAAGTAGGAPHVAAVGRDACEEEDEAVCADVGLRVGVAEGKGVGAFAEEFMGEEVVALFCQVSCTCMYAPT